MNYIINELSANQISALIIICSILLGIGVVLYGLSSPSSVQEDFKIKLDRMTCDAILVYIENTNFYHERALSLTEYGERCP